MSGAGETAAGSCPGDGGGEAAAEEDAEDEEEGHSGVGTCESWEAVSIVVGFRCTCKPMNGVVWPPQVGACFPFRHHEQDRIELQVCTGARGKHDAATKNSNKSSGMQLHTDQASARGGSVVCARARACVARAGCVGS